MKLLARARYNNIAETQDELSFRQGDILTILKKDFKKQLDWWLCELNGKVGMVPANYLEIFHDHDTDQSTYDIPRPSSKSASASPHATPLPPSIYRSDDVESPIYDKPPADFEVIDRDYDLPPPEAPASFEPGHDIYDRPPSSTRLSPIDSFRSSVKSNNRISVESSASSSRNSNTIYDFPPDIGDIFDLPKPTVSGSDEKDSILMSIDISSMFDDEADELLTSYRQLMTATYDVLYQTVYGPDAYWGTEHKQRQMTTLKHTLQAVKHFDRALVALLEFGKGVVNALGSTSDDNFKRTYTNAFRGLIQKRHEILSKVEQLNSEINSITATVKSLLETARLVPKSVSEFTVLIGANKALLFKVRSTSTSNLPVITKNEIKVRPLPELPGPNRIELKEGDYAVPADKSNGQKTLDMNFINDPNQTDTNTVLRRRKPNDHLPPLPHANTPKQPTRPPKVVKIEQSPRPSSPLGSEVELTLHHQKSPVTIRRSDDYDEIDKIRDRSIVLNKRPSLASSGSSHEASPTHSRIRREQSLSSCSGSSEELSAPGFRRVNSADLLDSPYGRANGHLAIHHVRQSSSPQPLREEDKEFLERFSKQLDLIVPSLRETIEIFINCLLENEPPRDFVTKSKLTVVAAYKLVYIADALTQKILHADTKASILVSSNELTDAIKGLVSATKTAALQYPSVIAKDKMADNLKLIFPASLDLINSIKTRSSFI